MRLLLAILFISTTPLADPEPIHRDESPAPTIALPPTTLNPNHKAYVIAHQEIRHVEPRSKEECMELTHKIVNEDFIKCRNGYDYKAWITGHFIDQ